MKKYKPGDKVVIRDNLTYPDYIKKKLEQVNYVVTIDDDIITNEYEYCFAEIPGAWKENAVIGLYEEPIPINSRFDIIDIR